MTTGKKWILKGNQKSTCGLIENIYFTGKWVTKMNYKIVRFFREANNKTMQTGLTLQEAQAHCSRNDTRGDGWFDGYTKQ